MLQCSAFSRAHLVVGRVICGVGTGIDTSTVPMYQAELSHAKTRGRLVCSELLFVSCGVVTAYWYDYGMTYVGGSISWRLPIASQIIFALVRPPSPVAGTRGAKTLLTYISRSRSSWFSAYRSLLDTFAKWGDPMKR